MTPSRLILSAVLVVLGATAPAHAERTLTLDEALSLADRANLSLAAARTRIDVVEQAVRLALAALYPVVSAQGRYTHNYTEVAFQGFVVQPREQLEATLLFSAPLVAPAADPGVASARDSKEASRADVETARANILVGVEALGREGRRHHLNELERVALDAAETCSIGNGGDPDIGVLPLSELLAERPL